MGRPRQGKGGVKTPRAKQPVQKDTNSSRAGKSGIVEEAGDCRCKVRIASAVCLTFIPLTTLSAPATSNQSALPLGKQQVPQTSAMSCWKGVLSLFKYILLVLTMCRGLKHL